MTAIMAVIVTSFLSVSCFIVKDSPKDQKAALGDDAILANKWLMDLEKKGTYRLYQPLKLAVLMDPFLHETYSRLGLGSLEGDDFVQAVAIFARYQLYPIQLAPAFKEEPSRMPWGAVGGGLLKKNVYRRHMPSDMNAMKAYTGKISAGCESLTLFVAGLFRLKGTPAQDIVHLRLPEGHTIGLVRFGGKHYYIDNTSIQQVDPASTPWITQEHYKAIFGETVSLYKKFKLKAGAFACQKSLAEDISESAGLGLEIHVDDLAGLPRFDLASIRERLTSGLAAEEPERARLVAYAAQLRAVDDSSIYAEASLRGPLAMKLAKKLKTAPAAADWIQNNVADGSIYSDGEERVQTADQTIVYRKGTKLDRALLAYALFTHLGGDPRLDPAQADPEVILDGVSFAF